MLIITAHCDDLELGLGAAIPNIKDDISVLILTESGYRSSFSSRSNGIAREESTESLSKLGIKNIYFGEYKTGNLSCNFDSVGFVEKFLDSGSVLTHWHGDHHQDHKACFDIAQAAARHNPSFYGFSSGVATTATAHPFTPNCFIPCTKQDVLNQIECCKIHKSEWEKFSKFGNVEAILLARAIYFGSLCNKPYATGLVQYRGLF